MHTLSSDSSFRHCYCIIAHRDAYCLHRLIALLDDERNDICLVFDKKSDLRNQPLPHTKKSNLFTPESEQLVDIQWGGETMLKAEMLAFETALAHGPYAYYHLVSGQDLPIKSQDAIHAFFDGLPYGSNCLSVEHSASADQILSYNCGYRHLFTDKQRCPKVVWRKTCTFLRRCYVFLQQRTGYHRDWTGYELGKGHQWGSFSEGFIRYMVERKKLIFHLFHQVLVSDEIYKQTLLLSSPYQSTRLHFEDRSDSLRHIDWNRGVPYVWRKGDFDELMECNEFVARKFDSNVDKEIIDLIYNRLKNE